MKENFGSWNLERKPNNEFETKRKQELEDIFRNAFNNHSWSKDLDFENRNIFESDSRTQERYIKRALKLIFGLYKNDIYNLNDSQMKSFAITLSSNFWWDMSASGNGVSKENLHLEEELGGKIVSIKEAENTFKFLEYNVRKSLSELKREVVWITDVPIITNSNNENWNSEVIVSIWELLAWWKNDWEKINYIELNWENFLEKIPEMDRKELEELIRLMLIPSNINREIKNKIMVQIFENKEIDIVLNAYDVKKMAWLVQICSDIESVYEKLINEKIWDISSYSDKDLAILYSRLWNERFPEIISQFQNLSIEKKESLLEEYKLISDGWNQKLEDSFWANIRKV